MRKRKIVHFQCLQDDDRREPEIAGILATGRLAPDELTVMRPFEAPVRVEALTRATHVLIGGSAWSVWEDIPYLTELRVAVVAAIGLGHPTLGICFGGQFLAWALGGKVVRDKAYEERGVNEIDIDLDACRSDALFGDMPVRIRVQSSHHDRISRLPNGARRLASSQGGAVTQAFAMDGARVWGLQFHPERRHDETPLAGAVLERFLSL